MKEATFYLHDWMIAEENKKETFSADVLSLRQDLQNFCNSLNSLVLCNGLVIEAKTVFYIFLSRRITKHLKHYISYTAHMIKYWKYQNFCFFLKAERRYRKNAEATNFTTNEVMILRWPHKWERGFILLSLL